MSGLEKGRSFKVEPVVGINQDSIAEGKLAEAMKVNNKILNDAAADAVSALKELDTQDQVKSQIPVAYFKSQFANQFQEMIDTNTAKEEVVIDWLKIAGGGHREVELTNDKKEVVDVVPPIINNTPAFSSKENKTAKEMTQAMLLYGDNGDSFHPGLDAEGEKREYLAAIGGNLSQKILTDETNIANATKFKQVVQKYSNKLSDEDLENIVKDSETKKVYEYDIE